MTAIKLGKSNQHDISFDLPTLIDTRLLIQSNSGGGKSYAIRRILEQSHGRVQQIVLDLEGEFSTLRQKYDYVIAGKDGDAPATPQSAKLLARRLLELEVSAICDLYELKAHDRIRFVRLFLESLMNAPRRLWHPVLVIVDEAHHFCPEKGQAESARAVIDLCTRGRKRGFCGILATQRLSKLHKDACAELLNKMIGRTSLDIDQARAADELGFRGKQDRVNLRNLKPGEFHIYGPALSTNHSHSNEVIIFKVGSVISRHPKIGDRKLEAPSKPTDKIKRILSKLTDLPEEARRQTEDITNLKKQNADLRRQLTINEKRNSLPRPCNHAPEIRGLKNKLKTAQSQFKTISSELHRIGTSLNAVSGTVERAQLLITENNQIVKNENANCIIISKPAPSTNNNLDSEISRPQQNIINVLATFEKLGLNSVHKTAVAVFAGVSPTSGGYYNNLGRLRSSGFIEYPTSSYVSLTDNGRGIADIREDISSLDDFHEAWYHILPNSQASILRVLIDVYPNELNKNALADLVGVSQTSGGYFNNLGRLRTLKAIEYPSKGKAKATELLFPEGLN